MNIYENVELERKLDVLSDLMAQLILDMLLISLRKTVSENQIFQEWVNTKYPISKESDPF